MEIIQELLPGAFVLKSPIFEDIRGSLTVDFETKSFHNCTGLRFDITQTMRAVSRKYVLRGLHYQDNTKPVLKIVICTVGKIYDVIVDLRVSSPSYGKWASIELSRINAYQLVVPAGFAHGYLSLTDTSEVFYYQSGDYDSTASRILSWKDSDIAIKWPWPAEVEKGLIISDRDRNGESWSDYKNNPMF